MAKYDITAFGAIGDGAFDNTSAFSHAIAACAEGGGGTVYVPAGTYLTGRIKLVSHMTLEIETGATILFKNEFDAYPAEKTRWSGYECYGYSPLLFGSGLERVAIKGGGVIDGQGDAWWQAYRKLRYEGAVPESSVRLELLELNRGLRERIRSNIVEWDTQFLRPPLLQLIDCRDIAIEGVTLRHSPFWNTHLVYCEGVRITGVAFINPSDAPNGDGLDIDSCSAVLVSNCRFDVGDDCLCLKSGIDEDGRRVGRPTEYVTVTNCVMKHGHGGIVMGSETAGGIRHIVVSNCLFIGTDRGIRMKTNRARGGGVEDVNINGIQMRDVLCPIVINAFYRHGIDESNPLLTSHEPVPISDGTPVIRRISISNLTARNALASAGFLYGLPEMPIEDVELSHITVEMTEDPEEAGGEPDMVKERLVMAGEGMYFKHVRGLTLHQVRVETRQGPAVRLAQTEGAFIDGVHMRRRHLNTEIIEQ
ncbi:glycoside hydrolase family 28 protein [Paenibacillus nanensis]|uniref:Glycoside hydrolase family 28 protein n=1 Tax=Paenibacillus nanensis TaxID=393251 RepID=A0A3A1VJ64_9BACL|nr:glycoside hydrolase family 28 protein [Paenibacillus nanensis]RIX60354.1 glycoside hydrolase family 28 protein [Paenibacillus nanensis]